MSLHFRTVCLFFGSFRIPKVVFNVVMHQSIPAAPSTPPGYCGAFARLVSPGGGAFANPGAIPELLTRTRFPIRK